MSARTKWSRRLLILGVAALVLGALDPMEGSIVVLAASALVAIAERLSPGRHRRASYGAFFLVVAGVLALWTMSAIGGISGHTGRSLWWALVLLPYPAGWLLGLVVGVKRIREEVA